MTEEDIKVALSKDNSLNESSLNLYSSRIFKFKKYIETNNIKFISLNTYEKLYSVIQDYSKGSSENVAKSNYFAVLKYLKNINILPDTKELREFNKNLKAQQNDKVKPVMFETETKESVDEVINLQNEIIKDLYQNYPPRRSEYISVKFKDIDKDIDNFYDGYNLVFNQYKTGKIYQRAIIQLRKETRANIDKLIKMRAPLSTHIFLNKFHRPFSTSSWTMYLKSYFGKSTNDFRKAFVQKHVNKEEVKKAIDIAKSMGNDVKVQTLFYNI
jgi:integrase